jgi:VWFA-related protein
MPRLRPHARRIGLPILIAALACGSAASLIARQTRQTPRPVFRSGTDVVTVPVSIRSNGTPVAGLTPSDFVVLDNGVPQTVEVEIGETVPADITLVVETSAAMAPYLKSIEGQMRKIASMIRPDDRLEVLEASTYVGELVPLRSGAARDTLPALMPAGLSSINDALVAALLREPDASRPHLIIALSDTIDTMSATTMKTVRDVAKYSSSILTIAWITMDLLPQLLEPPFARASSERAASQRGGATAITVPPIELYGGVMHNTVGGSGSNNRTEPWTRGWHPHYDPPVGRRVTAFDPLKDAAEMTGGKLYLPGVFADRTASVIFDKLYSDYRQRYVLRYTATGVTPDGWHDVTVTVPKIANAEIDAKRGYFVEKR